MRRLIIITVVLLATTVAITVVYFKKLNAPAAHAVKVMHSIPNTAALIFEFGNDNGFYDIFTNNNLFTGIAGKEKIDELSVLRKTLLLNPLIKNFFTGQHIYVSAHGQAGNTVNLLLTASAGENFSISHLEQLVKQKNTGMVITNTNIAGKEAYTIFFNELKKRFYLVDLGSHIFSGSFSKELALQSAQYHEARDDDNFVQAPDQENSNSLANLYINYAQLTPLFDQCFINKNAGILKSLRMLPALATLTLNYKADALMFNGLTDIKPRVPLSYLMLFRNQLPVVGHLKDIFPATTAISTSFSLSDIKKFTSNLNEFHITAGLTNEKSTLFTKVKKETGLSLITDFNSLLAGEFAVLSTRYDEKFAIVSLKDGSQTRPLMVNISTMVNDDIGQWKYEKLPFFLLGDSFSIFSHPYFIILDNYLVLANSVKELNSFKDSYQNHKFINKTAGYSDFDNLLAQRSNIGFFLHFRNIFPILKREMKPGFADLFNPESNRPDKYYALSWQFSATDGNYYTNLYMCLNKVDTAAIKNLSIK